MRQSPTRNNSLDPYTNQLCVWVCHLSTWVISWKPSFFMDLFGIITPDNPFRLLEQCRLLTYDSVGTETMLCPLILWYMLKWTVCILLSNDLKVAWLSVSFKYKLILISLIIFTYYSIIKNLQYCKMCYASLRNQSYIVWVSPQFYCLYFISYRFYANN